MNEAVLLLGSNLGNPAENIAEAIKKLESEGITICADSGIYYNKAVEFASNNIFCNIALSIKTGKTPVKLLNCVKKIEEKMGRADDTKITGYYTDRIIDIDIVSMNRLHFFSDNLEIPHEKHLYHREFSAVILNKLNKK